MDNGPESDSSGHSRESASSVTAHAAFVACAVAVFSSVAYWLGVTVCPLKRFLGFPCPTCGSTRAAMHLFHGDVSGAFVQQPLATFVFVCVVPALALLALLLGFRRFKRIVKSVAGSLPFWLACTAALLANWVYVIRHGN